MCETRLPHSCRVPAHVPVAGADEAPIHNNSRPCIQFRCLELDVRASYPHIACVDSYSVMYCHAREYLDITWRRVAVGSQPQPSLQSGCKGFWGFSVQITLASRAAVGALVQQSTNSEPSTTYGRMSAELLRVWLSRRFGAKDCQVWRSGSVLCLRAV